MSTTRKRSRPLATNRMCVPSPLPSRSSPLPSRPSPASGTLSSLFRFAWLICRTSATVPTAPTDPCRPPRRSRCTIPNIPCNGGHARTHAASILRASASASRDRSRGRESPGNSTSPSRASRGSLTTTAASLSPAILRNSWRPQIFTSVTSPK
eukprot:CAMPEP_0181392952 /NCGR_PEP_ID=MMETSP1106-20121128/26886_1 /TAXON_ID=81844 /ORGANISM="Mantoniella antarctica, Strain SL-175" /LENGTH=152 /DNA_ID=CAMNT_0023514151 /DNA_START=88 /DNA_END=546 /DNA_ORIENTATION=+